jgi:hypothetical protein
MALRISAANSDDAVVEAVDVDLRHGPIADRLVGHREGVLDRRVAVLVASHGRSR